jgi:hypothetical protein
MSVVPLLVVVSPAFYLVFPSECETTGWVCDYMIVLLVVQRVQSIFLLTCISVIDLLEPARFRLVPPKFNDLVARSA